MYRNVSLNISVDYNSRLLSPTIAKLPINGATSTCIEPNDLEALTLKDPRIGSDRLEVSTKASQLDND